MGLMDALKDPKVAKMLAEAEAKELAKNQAMQSAQWTQNPLIEGVGKAGQAIKQGMANQGAINQWVQAHPTEDPSRMIDIVRGGGAQGSFADTYRQGFFNAPMAIPALGGALGTGALMAGGAGAMAGGAADLIISEKLKTDIEQAKAKKAMDLAKALEAANPELVGEIHAKSYDEMKRKK